MGVATTLPVPASSSPRRGLSRTKRPSRWITGRLVPAVAAACLSSRLSSAAPSHARHRGLRACPDGVRRDPARHGHPRNRSPAAVEGDLRPSLLERACNRALQPGSRTDVRRGEPGQTGAAPLSMADHPLAADLSSPAQLLSPQTNCNRSAGSKLFRITLHDTGPFGVEWTDRASGHRLPSWTASFTRPVQSGAGSRQGPSLRVTATRSGSRTARRAGSNGERSMVRAFPSRTSSATASPVAGALRMPQTLWPVAT